MKIRLINLDRSPDRLAEFESFNGHMKSVARFAAIDGERLDMAALAADPAIGKDIAQCYAKGAIGNALSHLAMWHEAIEANSVLTVCEDDAIFNRHFSEAAQRAIGGLPPEWDMILWGWNFDGEMVFDMLPGVSPALCGCDQNRMRLTLREFQAQDIVPRPFKLLRAFGTPCYSVSPKGAQVLKASCFPIRPLNVHFPGINRGWPNVSIDIAMNNIYPQIGAYVSMPPLVLTKNEVGRSTIQTRTTA